MDEVKTILQSSPEDNIYLYPGQYGGKRLQYLQEHDQALYNELVATGGLEEEIRETERAAQERLGWMMPQMAKSAGATEELKRRDQMAWVRLMNMCRAQVDEIIYHDLVYC